mgnify:CR=1 FL=1
MPECAHVQGAYDVDDRRGRVEGSQGPGGRTGRGDGEVTEEALRRELGLDLEELWEQAGLSEDEAAALAVEAQHATRRRR